MNLDLHLLTLVVTSYMNPSIDVVGTNVLRLFFFTDSSVAQTVITVTVSAAVDHIKSSSPAMFSMIVIEI